MDRLLYRIKLRDANFDVEGNLLDILPQDDLQVGNMPLSTKAGLPREAGDPAWRQCVMLAGHYEIETQSLFDLTLVVVCN